MKKIALTYGIISGIFIISSMIIGFMISDGKGFGSSQILGFSIMIVALSFIFMGVKKYRDETLGGLIKFWPAFGLGVAISAVAGVMYIIGWEIYLHLTDHQFIQDYTAHLIEKERLGGMNETDLAAFTEKMQGMKENYANPFYRVPMTFTEIFPVGALIALISAAILRKPNILPAKVRH